MEKPNLYVTRTVGRRGRVTQSNGPPQLRLLKEEFDEEEFIRGIIESEKERDIPKRFIRGDDGWTILERRVSEIKPVGRKSALDIDLFKTIKGPGSIAKIIEHSIEQGYEWEFSSDLPSDEVKKKKREIKERVKELYRGSEISYNEPRIDSSFCFNIGSMSVCDLMDRGFDEASANHPEIFYDKSIACPLMKEYEELLRINRPQCLKVRREGRRYRLAIFNAAGIISAEIHWSHDSGKKEREYPLNFENADWARQLQKNLVRFVKSA